MRDVPITRGNTVVISVNFLDANGQPTTPSGAEVRITYNRNGVLTTDTVALSATSGGFVATWDTSVSDVGAVYWHARSLDPQPIARDGEFIVFANPANPTPSP